MKKYLERIYGFSFLRLEVTLKDCLLKNQKQFVITVNPEIIMKSFDNEEISNILLNKDNILTPDGISVVKKCRKYKINVRERITGIDLTKMLLELANEYEKSIYLYGSKNEVLKKLVHKIKKEYKNIKIVGYKDGYCNDIENVRKEIKEKKPDLCLVALGVPMQELFIESIINEMDKGIFVGVGGTFDVLSGYKKRAPKIFIKLHLEWLYRIIKEPKRLKRFWQNNVKFMFKR